VDGFEAAEMESTRAHSGRVVSLFDAAGQPKGRTGHSGSARSAAPMASRSPAHPSRPSADPVSLLQWVAATRGLAAAIARAERLRTARSLH